MLLVKQTELLSLMFGDEKAVKIIKDAGFDAIDFSMFTMDNENHPLNKSDYRNYAESLKKYANSLGLNFVQGHSPFPCYGASRPEYSEKMRPYLLRSIEFAGILGVEHLVIHPIADIPKDIDKKTFNMNYYRELLPYAKEYNVKICLENMWGFDNKRGYIIPNVCSWATEFADFLDTLDSEYFVGCLDLGHCGLIGEDADVAIRTLGKDRLKALHVHDNDHRNDTHTLPFYGKMDWNAITNALHDINYTGNLTYEADNFLAPLPHEEKIMLSACKLMETVGRYLIDKIEK